MVLALYQEMKTFPLTENINRLFSYWNEQFVCWLLNFTMKWCLLVKPMYIVQCNIRILAILLIETSIWFVHKPKNNSNATFIIQFFRTSKVKLKVKVKTIINANILWNSCFVRWLFKTYSNLRSWTLVNFSLLFLAFNSWILHNL